MQSDLLCKKGLLGRKHVCVCVHVYMWRREGGVRGDTDLPLINTDGDQGERQDDED